MKLINEQGFLTKEGEKNPAVVKFKRALEACLSEDLTIHETQIMGSILQKMVGDSVSNAAQFKRNEINSFNKMTDEEFDKYLEEKYKPIYGDRWILSASISPEEAERSAQSFKRRIQNIELPKHEPINGVRLDR